MVYVPFSEFEWVREHRVQRNVPGGTRSDDTPSRTKYAEFKLGDELVLELDKYLTAERLLAPAKGSKWLGGGRSRSQHYPLTAVRGGFARVEWGVRPKLRAFLNEIGPFVAVKPALGSAVDFRTITELPKEEQEQHLLELIEIGDRIGAIKVAKRLYKFNTTEAVQFIDEFSARQSNKL